MAKNQNFVEMVKAGPRPGEKEAKFGNRVLAAAEVIVGRQAPSQSYGRLAARGGRLPNILLVASRPRTNTAQVRGTHKTQAATQRIKRDRLQSAIDIMAEAAGVDSSSIRGSATIGSAALRLRDLILAV